MIQCAVLSTERARSGPDLKPLLDSVDSQEFKGKQVVSASLLALPPLCQGAGLLQNLCLMIYNQLLAGSHISGAFLSTGQDQKVG